MPEGPTQEVAQRMKRVTALDLAASAVDEFMWRSDNFDTRYPIVEADPNAQIGTVSPPYRKRDIVHAFVLTESAPRGIAVPLDIELGVTISFDRRDLDHRLGYFEHMHIAPATHDLATRFDREVAEFVRLNGSYWKLAFASAPMPVDHLYKSMGLEGAATCEGVTMRATIRHLPGERLSQLRIDMLFGLRVIGGAA